MPRSRKNQKVSLRVLNVNFQIIKNKKEELGALIDSSAPDVILGTETWLNSSVFSSEIFPMGYSIVRQDSDDGYGGVLIAVKNDITFEHLLSAPECESVFIKVPLQRNKSLILGSLYRAPSTGGDYMEKLCNVIKSITLQHKNSIFWIGGDLNLPDIDWNTLSSSGNHVPASVSHCFLDMLQDCNLQQMVTFPTRCDNILDLFITNRPALVSRCCPLPGIGDHDIVLVDSSLFVPKKKPVSRKIHLWKRADTVAMRKACSTFQESFLTSFNSSSSVNDMWLSIKTNLSHLLDMYVPSKMTSTRYSQPWVNTDVKKVIKEKEKAIQES